MIVMGGWVGFVLGCFGGAIIFINRGDLGQSVHWIPVIGLCVAVVAVGIEYKLKFLLRASSQRKPTDVPWKFTATSCEIEVFNSQKTMVGSTVKKIDLKGDDSDGLSWPVLYIPGQPHKGISLPELMEGLAFSAVQVEQALILQATNSTLQLRLFMLAVTLAAVGCVVVLLAF